MNFGLKEEEIKIILDVFKKFPEIKKVLIFGSRAKGNFRSGSDIDLVYIGNLSYDDNLKLKSFLGEETFLPYHFDLINYSEIENDELKKHIDRVGKIIYQK